MGQRCMTDAPPPVDGGTCVAQYQECTNNGLPCCVGLQCTNTPMGQRCVQSTLTDGGACIPFNGQCANNPNNCCAGLSCQSWQGSQRCRPLQDGGIIFDGGSPTPDASACATQWMPCENTPCCSGLTCTDYGGFVKLCQ